MITFHIMENSPFLHEGPVGPDDLCDREEELRSLSELIGGSRFVQMAAPRRYGKTSLLRAAQDAARDELGATCIYCDLDGIVSIADLATRLHAAYSDQLAGNALKWAREKLTLTGYDLSRATLRGIEFSRPENDQAFRALIEALLDVPATLAERKKRPVCITFDEFQTVLALTGADSLLRSHIQHQLGRVAYIFAGSEPSMMAKLFSNRARPLYGQALPFDLGPLPNGPLSSYIAGRFEATDRDPGQVLDALLALARGHPQRAMLLAHELWTVTPRSHTADGATWQATLAAADRRSAAEFDAAWRALDQSERRVLRAIAEGDTIRLRRETSARLNLPPSTNSQVRHQLADMGYIFRKANGDQITDPLFERYILKASARRPA